MPRPILILFLVFVVIVAVLIGLAMLDREVPQTRVEVPVTNASQP